MYAKQWRGCWENLKLRKTAANHNIYVKLKNMQIQIIINSNILKTWNRNFARVAGVHYNHNVSPSVR